MKTENIICVVLAILAYMLCEHALQWQTRNYIRVNGELYKHVGLMEYHDGGKTVYMPVYEKRGN